MADAFAKQTPEMLAMVLDDIAAQEQYLFRDPAVFAALPTEEKASVWKSCNARREIFALVLSLIPDQPQLRIQIIADVLGAMTVMAGQACEHGSCFTEENVFDAIELWRTRLPLLDMSPTDAPRN